MLHATTSQSFSDIPLPLLNNETTAGFVVGVDNYYYIPTPTEEREEANFSAVITLPIQEILDSFELAASTLRVT